MLMAAVVAGLQAFAGGQDVERPPADGGPTKVALGIYVVDLWQVDGARQSYSADVVVFASWTDPRLKHDGPAPRRLDPDKVWTPRIHVVNARFLRTVGERQLSADSQGNVTSVERLSGELSCPLDLAAFPFDRQRLELRRDRTGKAKTLSVADWDAGAGGGRPEAVMHEGRGEAFPGVVFEIEVARRSGYYVWKVFLPLLFIVMMSWTVFWMDPGKLLGSQVSVSVTSMLTLTAYRFSLGGDVPKVSYLTTFDRLLTVATVFVFLALVEVILVLSLETKGRLPLARKIDVGARWGFPAGLVLTCAWILGT